MRFFRHGEALAIVLPESVRKASDAKEGDEYEFLQLEPGAFLLINKRNLEGMAKAGVVAEMAKKMATGGAAGGTTVGTVASVLAKPPAPAAGAKEDLGVTTGDLVEPEKALELKGYLVIENENEAKRISQNLERKIKGGDVLGVRGFDKKFYILSRQFYSAFYPRLVKAISAGPMSSAQIAESLKLSEPACTALLQVMKDGGEVIEKRKGTFTFVK